MGINTAEIKRFGKLHIACILLIAALGNLALADDNYASSTTTEGPVGRIVIAQPTRILYDDPNVAKSSTDANYFMAIWDALVTRDAAGNLVPMIAESWENPTPTEWIFHIRKNIEFTNGEPLDAHAVVATIDRVTTPMRDFTVVYQDYIGFDSWEALDDHTVRITTKEPDPLFLGRLVRMFITPPRYIAEVGDEEFAARPIGSGPFKFVRQEPDQYIILEANTDYWQGSPKVQSVEFRIIPDEATRLQALRAGEVDIVQGIAPDYADVLNRGDNTKTVEVLSARTPFVWVYPSSPMGGSELQDKRVRQALNYAIDVQSIIDHILSGRAERISTQIPPMTFAYNEDLEPYPYDPEKAKQLLAEAGYPNGFKLVMEVPQAGITPKPVEVGQTIAAYLGEVGVQVEVRPREFASWFHDKTEGNGAPLMLWSWGGGDYFDPEPYLHSVYHPESTRYVLDTSPSIWKLIEDTLKTTDQDARAATWKQVQENLKDEAYAIFLYTPYDIYGVNKDLVWEPRADERIVVWDAYFKDQ